jgi:hypothetical protein
MKGKTIVAIAIICFSGIGCKSKVAMNYNDMIVEKQKNLGKIWTRRHPIKNYFASYQYDSIASVSSRMEIKIDTIIKEIAKKPAPSVKQEKISRRQHSIISIT